MKRKTRNRLSAFLWVAILIFLGVVLSFPKWITIFYPLPNHEIVFSTAREYDMDPYLVFAIIRAESKYQTSAQSPVGARGLMQIMPETAEWIAQQMNMDNFDTETLHQPEVNIRMGCWYLKSLNTQFKGNIPLMAAAYNAGQGQVKEWVEEGSWNGDIKNMDGIPFPETKQYVRNVMKNYEAYKAIYSDTI